MKVEGDGMIIELKELKTLSENVHSNKIVILDADKEPELVAVDLPQETLQLIQQVSENAIVPGETKA